MKKLLIIFLICFYLSGSLYSANERLYQTISTYYRVYSNVSEEYTKEIANKMEACLKLFNEIFHFDLSQLDVKLKVVIYADQSSFDTYLQKLLGQTRTDFVYIHYSDLVKSELVGYQKDDEDTFNALLLHQGLIQFLKAFAPTAPMWLQEGIAAYIESSTYNSETKAFTLEKNLAWLDTLKTILRGEGESAYLTVSELLIIDKDTAISKINTFYPEVWGLVYFLMNSNNKTYNRILWDAISIIDPELTMRENSLLIKNYIFNWVTETTFEEDYISFIQSLKTFQDQIQDGINYYSEKKMDDAKTSFTAAKEIKPTDSFAYYYLGLIEYANKEYYNAEQYYLQALSLEADAALTYYALGVNAYADNEFDSAEAYLKQARTIDAEKYWEKVQEILDRIEAENLYSDSGDDIYISPLTDGTDTTADTSTGTAASTDNTTTSTDTSTDITTSTDTSTDTSAPTDTSTDTSTSTDSSQDTATDSSPDTTTPADPATDSADTSSGSLPEPGGA